MNGTTVLIWVNIAIVAIIAIILVKWHYSKKELETSEPVEVSDSSGIKDFLSATKERITESSPNEIISPSSFFNRSNNNAPASLRKEGAQANDYAFIVPEVGANNSNNIEYESPNQVLVNYGNEVKKFQEPIKQSQMDIMTQNRINNKDDSKHELKDLFTIDELIKESKRKDNEREKESKRISDDKEDLDEIKESIKMRKEGVEEKLIEEVEPATDSAEETIADIINEESTEIKPKEDVTSSQKEINEAIESATKESDDEIEDLGEEDITETLLNSKMEEEIKAPTLKTPSKIDDTKNGVSILSGEDEDYKFGGQLEDSELFNDDMNDLDYRKDLAKVTNKIKNSRLLQDVKDKFTQDAAEPQDYLDETFIRNVREYDEYEPIINETHVDYDGDYEVYHEDDFDQRIREENTRKILKSKSGNVKLNESSIPPIKEKPSKSNIKINLNNNEVVLKKGDEIIFKHEGETYSSQVYAINGDDISVRYRRKQITIKPDDIKKVY